MNQTTVNEFWHDLSGNERIKLCKVAGYKESFPNLNPRFLNNPPCEILFYFEGDSLFPVDFDSKESAMDWMSEEVNDTCQDNERFAFIDCDTMEELEEEEDYNNKLARGCCGSFDAIVKVNGRVARIGCNFGH
jgi:hypothetical protein